jgi:hypothetical protein
VLLAAISTALLVAPVGYHRLVFRHHQKEHLVRAANNMALGGLATVGLSIAGAVLLVVSFVIGGAPVRSGSWLTSALATVRRTADRRPPAQLDSCYLLGCGTWHDTLGFAPT